MEEELQKFMLGWWNSVGAEMYCNGYDIYDLCCRAVEHAATFKIE